MFNRKISLFVEGRKKTYSLLENAFTASDKVIWMHVASLGEYEQGLPVLQQLKEKYPKYNILLTFFSPSGFEVKKDKTPADLVVYLPMDTKRNAKRFLDAVNPNIAIFIKYEIWPNYLRDLEKRNIPTVLVSGIFSKRQVFFKWYGGFMRKSLKAFSHFFVQEPNSYNLLNSIGFQNISISGDTRFDRVSEILEQNNTLDFMESFKGSNTCFVAGSTWPEDERILLDFINQSDGHLKFVIAPHNIKSGHIEALQSSITRKTSLYSEIDSKTVAKSEVLIINSIGLLTKIYSYADFAYVGGGFATGLHNTLEPAVFGIPVLIGPKYHQFNEAVEMVNRKGLLVVKNQEGFKATMQRLLYQPDFADQTGNNNSIYIQENVGATKTVIQHLETLL
jgi:3-deoxy-D-manno-octulosonic-acid transferase